ncbi:hypothetical protein OCS_01736 [Ophiocordyceps sinensis CO18]|uniref:Uncharacterized protein n=1 Tax=Ophiocordyceps sinensis (strain Co18 / CGMCC 3.14243) TaxID=911162 RepID=T5AAP2_OPHSC|nr:hypothetical protein OCS_01736 [Ophiocordyceps sinensis CO18]
MADGIVPAIDKVAAPEPAAPEAEAGAPTMDGSASTAAGLPSSANHEDKPAQSSETDKGLQAKVPDGAAPAVGAPKPAEVKSVPETPVNGATPADATPKPELKIPDEPATAKESPEEPVVTTEVSDPKAAPAVSAPESDAAPPPVKKAKVDDVPAQTNGGKPANGNPPVRKPGRPRKDKTAAPMVGRTARKTRSQGPAEA